MQKHEIMVRLIGIHQLDTKIPRLIFEAWILIPLARKLSGKFRSVIFT